MKRSYKDIIRFLKLIGISHSTAIKLVDGILPVMIGLKTSYLVDCVFLEISELREIIEFVGPDCLRGIYFTEPISQCFVLHVANWEEWSSIDSLVPIVVDLPSKKQNRLLQSCITKHVDRLLDLCKRNLSTFTIDISSSWRQNIIENNEQKEFECTSTAITGCLLNYGATYNYDHTLFKDNGLSCETLKLYTLEVHSKKKDVSDTLIQFSCVNQFEEPVTSNIQRLTSLYQTRWKRINSEEKRNWEEWIKHKYKIPNDTNIELEFCFSVTDRKEQSVIL
ncbi:DUF4504 family protein, human C1orf74 ortholog, implicated in transcription or signalling, possibly phosphate starvation response [Schizosaccharomyces pombe]|uniref:Uncharacterized protein C14F5.01 n=1 Tax=Schizosaccharomyces pombe (strain 972 / ATCC 24843) TaxID=284812 RepID=C14F5_SCHPO|nr:uncharacterized protein SPBC14F5.01 [Schizosaccharomyces pombe]O60098.2 RecName: Full=Uncharacterized protein C14F5.01 [Schizosaccharomyces pombe 972h-]CAB52746.2 sequence orphan [Schizosaccharomyces pombe]|eukprot:NP_596727.2 uncharacterized protein SPBC14F5.01 [Schizosaccharomyces pombe]